MNKFTNTNSIRHGKPCKSKCLCAIQQQKKMQNDIQQYNEKYKTQFKSVISDMKKK